MNRLATSLLCAAALAVSLAPSADAQSGVRQCDKAMQEADAMAQQVDFCSTALAEARAALKAKAAAAAPATAAVARASTTVWVEVSSGTLPEELGSAAKTEPLFTQLRTYYAHSAYALGDPGQCAPLAFLQMEADCRSDAKKLAIARAWAGPAATFTAACSQFEDPAGRRFSAECCALAATNRDSGLCAKLVPKCAPTLEACRGFFAGLTGDAAACRDISPGAYSDCKTAGDCQKERDECKGDAAFLAAFRAKDAALCRGSERCRVLMGEGKPVAREQAAALVKSPAGRWFVRREWQNPSRRAADVLHPPLAAARPPRAPAPRETKTAAAFRGFICEEPLKSEANRKAASAALQAAHGCLLGLELSLPRMSPETAREVDAREEKLARMNLRLREIFDGK